MIRQRILQCVSIVISIAALLSILGVCGLLMHLERSELERRTQAEAHHIATQLQTGMMGALDPLALLGKWWLSQGRPFDPEDWHADAQLFLGNASGLRQALWVSVEGIERWSAVPGKSPKNKAIRPDDTVKLLVEDARIRDSIVLSPVFDSPTIRHGMYVCIPVHGKHQTAGYIIGLYDASQLVSLLVEHGIPRTTGVSIRTGGRSIFSTFSSLSRSNKEETLDQFDLAGQVWTVAMRIPVDYFEEFKWLIITVIITLLGFIYAASVLLHVSYKRATELANANDSVRELNRELNHRVNDFETLLAVAPIGIAVAGDPRCRTIWANETFCRMLGVPESCNSLRMDADSATLGFRVCREGQELRPEEFPMHVAATTAQKVIGGVLQILRGDGTTVEVLSFAAPVFDEDRNVRGAIGVSVDISDHRALEKRLQQADRMQSLGAMAAGIAHDFNNGLTTIMGNAASALDRLPECSREAGLVRSALKSSYRLAELTTQVLTYTGTACHNIRRVNITDILNEHHVSVQCRSGFPCKVRFHIDQPLPKIKADLAQVQQVIDNVVQNAAEAIDFDGVIEVSASFYENVEGAGLTDEDFPAGGYVRVDVKDNGPGMSPNVVAKAFDPFFTTKFLGRGLGLSAVLGIMRAHNGAVLLETAPDLGTTVHLFFPVDSPKHNFAIGLQRSTTEPNGAA